MDRICSVIVPAYRAERTLPALLAALERQTIGRGAFELIVVDDGSPDATAEVAGRAGAKVLRQRNRGPAAARNAGARAAETEILVFTDADCEPAPDFLERLTAPLLADPRLVATKGAYRSRQPEIVARFVQIEYEEKYARMAALQAVHGGIDFIDTYAAAFRRDAFLAAGGFDETFPDASVEDQELSFRLAAVGALMRFVPEARVFHLHAASVGAYARKKWKIGWWKVAVLRRHPGKAFRDSHTPQSLKLQMLLVPLPPLFLLATIPFVLRALRPDGRAGATGSREDASGGAAGERRRGRRDAAVALAAPALLFVRAVALALGLVSGWAQGARLPAAAPAPALPAPERASP
jgi:GT2 family glycosyltransferase